LDDVFREDRSPARKCKNNLALVRKFAYNVLRLATIQEKKDIGIIEMMDEFDADWHLLEKYILKGIKPLN